MALAGQTVTITTMSDLPPEAGRDRQSYGRFGTNSVVVVSLSVGGGSPFGVLTFSVLREEREWPEHIVKGFQLIAQVFANALDRKQADEAFIRMKIPVKKREEALKIFRSTARHCRMRSGSINCHIYVEAQEDDVLMFEEMWRSEEDLERHLRSREYRNVLLVMEMALKHPEVRFNLVSTSTGIEMIEKARKQDAAQRR
jgi:quinol monooxygenase YgiN